MDNLSIILPAYNEEKNIKRSVLESVKIAQKICKDYEIIVVNDGSSDNTKNVVSVLAQKNRHIRLINQSNKGYGGAVWTGLKKARKNMVFFTDSDLQFDISEVKNFIPYLKDYDAVFGFRSPRRDPFMRLFNAWGWKILNRIFFGIKIKDIDCAFKLFKKEVIEKIRNINSKGAMFSAELIYRIIKNGHKIKELPVSHYPRKAGSPTGASPKVVSRAFKELWEFYRLKNKIKR